MGLRPTRGAVWRPAPVTARSCCCWPAARELLVTTRYVRSGRGEPVVAVVRRAARHREPPRAEEAQAQLLSTVAHELRSPLTSVKGFSATLLRRWDRFTDDQKRLMLETIEADADRVTRLIGELLDISRIDAGRLEVRRQPVDLVAVANKHVERMVASGYDDERVRRARRPSRCPRSGPTPTGSTRSSATCWKMPCATATARSR